MELNTEIACSVVPLQAWLIKYNRQILIRSTKWMSSLLSKVTSYEIGKLNIYLVLQGIQLYRLNQCA
jgi:hypothetical protein